MLTSCTSGGGLLFPSTTKPKMVQTVRQLGGEGWQWATKEDRNLELRDVKRREWMIWK